MHILVLPSAYNTKEHLTRGSFFKEQSVAVKKEGNVVGVIYSETRPVTKLSLSGIRDNHFQVEILSEDGINTVRLHGWNILSMRNPLGKRLWVSQMMALFERYMKEFGKPDVIHVHCGMYGGIAAMEIKKKYGIPYILTEHSSNVLNDSMVKWDKEHIGEVYDNSDCLIAVGSSLKLAMTMLTDKEIHIVPNIVNTREFFPIDKKSDSTFKFVSVSYLKKNKNVDMTIRAFAELYRGDSSKKLIIIGDGEEENNLKNLAIELGVKENVEFLGRLDRVNTASEIRRCDAFVLPSQYETFGVAYIEALASGIPIIVTKCGGPEDFFDESLGRMINVGSLEELKEAMKYIEENIFRYNRNDISKMAKTKFDEKVIGKRIIQLYKSVLHN